MGQVLHVLRTFGADQDPDGKFVVGGMIMSFMGMSGPDVDVVVGADAFFMKGGEKVMLVPCLGMTSYGNKVVVIGCEAPDASH